MAIPYALLTQKSRRHERLFLVDPEPDSGSLAVHHAHAARSDVVHEHEDSAVHGYRSANGYGYCEPAGRSAGTNGNRGGTQDREFGRYAARDQAYLQQNSGRDSDSHG